MIEPTREGDTIIAPRYAEADDGTVGMGWVRLAPGDPDYDMWDQWMRRKNNPDGRPPVDSWQHRLDQGFGRMTGG